MTKAKTQPEEVVEAEAEATEPEEVVEAEAEATEPEAPAAVLPGGNEPGVLPPSLQ